MKRAVTFEQGGKTYRLCFNTAALAALEESIGSSLLFMYAAGPAGLLKMANIRFTAAALQHGLEGIGDADPFDVIDEFCANGGLIDTLNGKILEALNATGFFVKTAALDEQALQQDTPRKKRK